MAKPRRGSAKPRLARAGSRAGHGTPHGYVELLRASDTPHPLERVEEGFPVGALERFQQTIERLR